MRRKVETEKEPREVALLAPATLDLPGGTIPVHVRRSPRARRLTIKVDAGEHAVELIVPQGVSIASAFSFLKSKSGWVAARVAVLPKRIAFADGAVIPLLGTPHRIRHLGDASRAAVSIVDGEIRVGGKSPHVARRVRDHLVVLARREMTVRARRIAVVIDRTVVRVAIRDTRTRWGSCTSAGVLSFSWRLLLAPESVLDYVVAHEVAHLVEMNHGARFWRLVETLHPGAAKPRAWLQHHRADLLRYG